MDVVGLRMIYKHRRGHQIQTFQMIIVRKVFTVAIALHINLC